MILLNFSSSDAQTGIRQIPETGKMLLSNYNGPLVNKKGKTYITLRPYEAIIYKL